MARPNKTNGNPGITNNMEAAHKANDEIARNIGTQSGTDQKLKLYTSFAQWCREGSETVDSIPRLADAYNVGVSKADHTKALDKDSMETLRKNMNSFAKAPVLKAFPNGYDFVLDHVAAKSYSKEALGGKSRAAMLASLNSAVLKSKTPIENATVDFFEKARDGWNKSRTTAAEKKAEAEAAEKAQKADPKWQKTTTFIQLRSAIDSALAIKGLSKDLKQHLAMVIAELPSTQPTA